MYLSDNELPDRLQKQALSPSLPAGTALPAKFRLQKETPTAVHTNSGVIEFAYSQDAREFVRYLVYCQQLQGDTGIDWYYMQSTDKQFAAIPKVQSFIPPAPVNHIPHAIKGISHVAYHAGKHVKSALKHLVFHADRLEQDVFLFCEVTGIAGRIEMPALPVHFDYQHPIAFASNALKVCDALWPNSDVKVGECKVQLEAQVLAGCILSLLRAKGKLPTENRGTTASERNLILQSAGVKGLQWLLHSIHRQWDNQTIWTRIPGLALDWTIAAGTAGILPALNSYARFISYANQPEKLESSELSAIYLSIDKKGTADSRKGIRVSNVQRIAQDMQATVLKDKALEGKELLASISGALPKSLRESVKRTMANLAIYGMEHKRTLAMQVRASVVGTASAEKGVTLANILEASAADKIEASVARFSDDLPKPRMKSIAEKLAERTAKCLDQHEGMN